MPKTITWQPFMSIFVIGTNHKTASVALREKIYFALDKLPLYLQDLLSRGLTQEAVLLSTCNRSELYCEANDIQAIYDWFCHQTSLTNEELNGAIYIYRDEQAVTHMMEVACGLDSMIIGEPQILGQMKEAFSESCAAGSVAASFHRLFQRIFALAKEIRTTTAIGACPVSVASAAIHFVKQSTQDFQDANVALIGAGETSELLIRYLKPHLRKPITLINRNIEKATNLVEGISAHVYHLDDLVSALAQADIVFSATGSVIPLVTKCDVARSLEARTNKSIMFVDIAVPRDVEPSVAELEQVKLYCIDDLKAIIATNRQGREHAAEKVREVIRQKSAEFIKEIKLHDKVSNTIRTYRNQIEDICRVELIKAKAQLDQGVAPSLVLDTFAAAFTKKLLHAPSVQLRQAGAEGKSELLRFAKQLFAIPDPEIERI